MNVVVVESPAKAKTINKYLGSDFKVLASYGHVRDLPAKDGSVRPDDDFSMDWEVDAKSSAALDDAQRSLLRLVAGAAVRIVPGIRWQALRGVTARSLSVGCVE